jgi:hypothetical protein
MTILDALKNKQIRYGAGKYFDEATRPGECLWIEDMSELDDFLKERAESHDGSVFVKFNEQLPAEVPTNSPEHTWAMALQVGADHKQVGAVVIWSSDGTEKTWRAGRNREMSFNEFNVRRHGQE